MAHRVGRIERLVRRVLLVLLVGLAAAVLWLWLGGGPRGNRAFDHIYKASVAQASGNFTLEAALGMPLRATRKDARWHLSHEDGRAHIRFAFPLHGPRGTAVIEGEAIQLGDNWLIVSLVAHFPGSGSEVDLSPNVHA